MLVYAIYANFTGNPAFVSGRKKEVEVVKDTREEIWKDATVDL